MGLLDGVKAAIEGVGARVDAQIGRTGSAKLAMAFAKFYPGGLPAFLERLRADGHGGAVESWLGAGENRTLDAAAIAAAIPDAVLARFADDLSLPAGRVPTALATFLPGAVADQSADGHLKPQPSFSTQIR